jgi:hypothetical protein
MTATGKQVVLHWAEVLPNEVAAPIERDRPVFDCQPGRLAAGRFPSGILKRLYTTPYKSRVRLAQSLLSFVSDGNVCHSPVTVQILTSPLAGWRHHCWVRSSRVETVEL